VTSASLITVLEAAMRKIRVNDKISKPEEKRKIGYTCTGEISIPTSLSIYECI